MSKKKISLAIIAAFVVLVASASVISYSIANKQNKKINQFGAGSNASGSSIIGNLGNLESISNIDLIIENSYNTDDTSNYYVLEIFPSGEEEANSPLKQYIENDGFKTWVIDENAELGKQMADKKIVYYSIVAGSNTAATDPSGYGNLTISDIINKADLIYLPSKHTSSYNKMNNMSEDIYHLLHNYSLTLGDRKPIIIDDLGGSNQNVNGARTYQIYCNNNKNLYVYYRTFGWDLSKTSINDFFEASGKSNYISYDVNKFVKDGERASGNILIVSNEDENGTNEFYQALVQFGGQDGINIINEAYIGDRAKRPEKIQYTFITPAELEQNMKNNGTLFDETYDFVYFEDNIRTTEISDQVYRAFYQYCRKSKYLIYPDSWILADGEDIVIDTDSNFHNLYNRLVGTDGVAKYNSVLLVNHDFFDTINSKQKENKAEAKKVADLINASVYRGHGGGSGGSDNRMYRVLEIEPCYPIDLTLAKTQKSGRVKFDGAGNNPEAVGAYYLRGDDVKYGVSQDEVLDGVEYYAFELSRAKIAHLTGLSINQIAIDYMSTEELISSKEVVSEYYDLIYIGGDKSALMPYDMAGWKLKASNDNQIKNLQDNKTFDKLTYFGMYTHTGILANLTNVGTRFTGITNTAPAGTIGNENTYVELNGNDLTTIKLDELVKYVDAGLPIIVDQAVTDAFYDCYKHDPEQLEGAVAKDADPSRMKQLAQREIDPDSNMYKLLKYMYGVKESVSNVCWGEVNVTDANAVQRVDNTDKKLGNSFTDDVEVYSDDSEKIYRDLIEASAYRPRIILSDKPKEYVEGSSDCVNIGPDVSFTMSLLRLDGNTGDYTVKLYMDVDGDNVFSDSPDELKDSGLYTAATDSLSLGFSLESDYIGPVNWKIVATDSAGKLCDMVQGIAYFKPQGDVKKKVRVLQIMPVSSDEQAKFGSGNGGVKQPEQTNPYSLYFCTECQMSSYLIKYNVQAGLNGHSDGDMISGFPNLGFGSRVNKDKILKDQVNVGLHEHNFGIVEYDKGSENDNWGANLADTLTHGGADYLLENGEYEFDLDILTNDQFEELCENASTRSDEDAEANLAEAEDYKFKYENILADRDASGATLILDEHKLSYLREKLETAMFDMAENIDSNAHFKDYIKLCIGTKAKPGQWIKDKTYYKLWEYFNGNVNGKDDIPSYMDDVVKAYNNYIAIYDEVVLNKQNYKEKLRESATATNSWLSNNYDVIVIGFAEDFGGKDLSQTACDMLKEYVDEGEGSVLNTHDSLTRYKYGGSMNLTNTLRSVFGQDRFHAVGSKSKVEVEYMAEGASFTMSEGYQSGRGWSKEVVVMGSDDSDIYLNKAASSNEYTVDDTKTTYSSGNVKTGYATITIHMDSYAGLCVTVPGGKPDNRQSDGNGIIKIEVPLSEVPVKRASFTLTEGKTTGTLDFDNKKASVSATSDLNADGSIPFDLDVIYNGSAAPDGAHVRVTCGGNTDTLTVTGGKISFNIDASTITTASIYDVPTDGTVYRKFDTEDDSKYFWTQRGIYDEDTTSRATWEKSVQYILGYNSPIGTSDYFATVESVSYSVGPYRYARNQGANDWLPAWANQSESYDLKYGTRNASQINKGCVTSYPFSVASELQISATHAQYYALDLEDPTVSVWYALGGTDQAELDGSKISSDDVLMASSFFAASPRDGMDSYFLYSKQNVFYCGAGNSTVTGRGRRNNDERRLFINVIVSCVNKGKSNMSLRLYNKCDKDENCEDNIVDKDEKKNAKLAKEENMLFYNNSIQMYQYNIVEEDGCPEFDFKAIAGSDNIEKIQVFYDLNYGQGTDLDYKDEYEKNSDHVMVVSYDKTNKRDNIRNRLREDGELETDANIADQIKKNLPLKAEYFAKYGNYTYMVIVVEDASGVKKTARIKVNVIPKLFDLT